MRRRMRRRRNERKGWSIIIELGSEKGVRGGSASFTFGRNPCELTTIRRTLPPK